MKVFQNSYIDSTGQNLLILKAKSKTFISIAILIAFASEGKILVLHIVTNQAVPEVP